MKKIKILTCIMAAAMLVISITAPLKAHMNNNNDMDLNRQYSANDSKKEANKKSDRKWYKNRKAKKNDKHEFNVTPEKVPERWKSINSHKDKLDTCQIPEKELDQISTEGLIDTCLEYPMFGDMMLFENSQDGISSISSDFNGLQELLDRSNSGENFYEIYRTIDFEELLKSDEFPVLRLKYLETIIAQKEILSSMSKSTRDELLKICANYMEIKFTNYPDVFDPIPSAWIIARILKMDNSEFCELLETNEALRNFEETGDFINISSEDVDIVMNFLFNAIELEGANYE